MQTVPLRTHSLDSVNDTSLLYTAYVRASALAELATARCQKTALANELLFSPSLAAVSYSNAISILPYHRHPGSAHAYPGIVVFPFSREALGGLARAEVAMRLQVSLGFVLSGPSNRCPVVSKFECILSLLDLLDHKSIFSAGYKSILHLHALVEECEVISVTQEMDRKTRSWKKCKFVKSGATVTVRIATDKPICAEAFDVNPQMGRFTLRDEGRTIAIGKITKLPPSSKPTTGPAGK